MRGSVTPQFAWDFLDPVHLVHRLQGDFINASPLFCGEGAVCHIGGKIFAVTVTT